MKEMFAVSAPVWNLFHLFLTTGLIAAGMLFEHRSRVRRRLNSVPSSPDESHLPLFSGAGSRASRVLTYLTPINCVAAITVVGFLVRLYGVNFGLPRPYHPDELQKAHFLKTMMVRDTLDPDFSLQPPFLLYLTWGVARCFDWIGLHFGNSIERNLLAGRLVNVLFATGSIPLVYLIGKRVSGARFAVIATMLFAFSPLHVVNSRYMKEDALFLFFVLGCVLAILRGVQSGQVRFLFVGSVFAGMALGSKYTGVVSAVIVAGSPWLVSREILSTGAASHQLAPQKFSFIPNWYWLRRVPFALLLMPLVFLLTAPYVIGDPAQVLQILEGFASESRHAMRGHMGLAIDPWSQLWMYHLSRSLIPGIGFLPAALGLFGIGIALRRWESTGLFLVGLVILFYLPAEWARSKPPPQPDRYVLPCVPFLALLAAEALREISLFVRLVAEEKLSKGEAMSPPWYCAPRFGALAIAAVTIPPMVLSIVLSRDVAYDTRQRMGDWMDAHLAPGQRILTVGGVTYLPRVPQKFYATGIRKVLGRSDDDLVERLKATDFDYLLVTNPTNPRFSVRDSEIKVRREGKDRAMDEIERSFRLVKQIRTRLGPYGFHNPVLRLYSLREAPPPPKGQAEAVLDSTARASLRAESSNSATESSVRDGSEASK